MSVGNGWVAPGSQPPDRDSEARDPRSASATPPSTQWQPAQRIVPQPGAIPLRPLQMGDIFGATTRIIRANPAATIGLAVMVSLVVLVPVTAGSTWLNGQADLSWLYDSNPSDDLRPTDVVLYFVSVLIPTLAATFAGWVLVAFVTYVVGQAVLGRLVAPTEAWRGGLPHLARVVAAALLIGIGSLLVTLAVAIPGVGLLFSGVVDSNDTRIVSGVVLLLAGIVLGLLAGLWLTTRTAFVGPSIVLEALPVTAAFARSWSLTAGRPFWRIFGIRLLAALVMAIAGQVLASPISMFTSFGTAMMTTDPYYLGLAEVLGASLTSLVTAALVTPVTATVDAILYLDQRFRREGLDVTLGQVAAGQLAPPWSAALQPPTRRG